MVAKLDSGTAAAQQNAGSPPLNCPRCDSTNTKFCYYNNYSLAQPRHFCKSCKRYWTRGGTLRNVPVGGGCRKNKRTKKSHRSAASITAAAPSLPPPPVIHSPATDLSSLLYGFPQMMNSSTVFFPKYELDAQFAGYEENFQSCLSAANIVDLQKSAAAPADFLGDYSLLNSHIPSSSSPMATEAYQPLLSYDDINMGTENNTSNRSINWQVTKGNPLEATNSFAASGGSGAVAQTPYLYWNQAMTGSWPESSSSVAPLI
ncbi:hypothetical protein IEQ34_016091 [Dendrobium chrysotoxum]|uniref:Dof zinc finger protein n=1 Tax=Dendrobium chrysotoxum TaxID=161865 RepID=A0AAV7GDD8_DENCH|nr:hypothetical protein IEQ34_016091 [Dendrobium chrysotoxum]